MKDDVQIGGEMMNCQERLVKTLRSEPVDRVPVVFRLGLQYIEHEFLKPIDGKPSERLQSDLLERLIYIQEELGLDPVIYPHWWHGMFISSWPSAIFSWRDQCSTDWQLSKEIDREKSEVTFQVRTPKGNMTSTCRYSRDQKWTLDYFIKEEKEIELLHYRPDPECLDTSRLKKNVDYLGNRGIVNLIYPCAWDEALHLRGMNNLLTDVYDRPGWVKELLEIIADYSVRVLDKICKNTGLQCVMQNDSFISLVSPKIYDQFVAEHDRRMIAVVKKNGVISDFHNCGKTNPFLERMVDAGPDAIETLTPPGASSGGDIELRDAKRRVGNRVCLMGGFNEKVLVSDDPEDVRQEARRCLDAAKEGGGYVLYAAGQIFDARRENFKVLAEVIRDYGTYH
jgi:uroporphyrinogen decarboxylase